MASFDFVVLCGIALCTLAVYCLNRVRSPLKGKLPPGPSGIPLFGNLFQVDALRPHPQFRKWAQEYGPIFSIQLGAKRTIVLNTAQAADELLGNRSKKYSGRPDAHVGQDIVSDGQRMVLMPYDREWKIARRTVQGALGAGPSKRVRKMQEFEARVMMYDLVCHGDKSITETHVQGPNGEVPEKHWFSITRRYTTSVVMHLAYGQRIHRIVENPHLHNIYNVMSNFTHVMQAGNYFADTFVPLRWLPDFLASWRVETRKMHEWEMELWGGFFSESRTASHNGIARGGFVPSYLRARAEAGFEELPGKGVIPDGAGWMRDKMLAYTAATVLEAGSDTTSVTIHAFVLFMLNNPEALQRAREEIDSVVGVDRMPAWEDEEKLPWLVACIKETLRRRTPTILAIPHKADEDDVYEGYYIPKGSTVIGNVWAIHMDPERYPNPEAFDPGRFYHRDKPTRWASGPDSHDRDHYAFGWGRRYCQGSHLAQASLFIVLSRLIWGIDFYAPLDPQTGRRVVPDVDDEEGTWGDGLITGPHIFPVGFKSRSEKHAQVIKKAFEEVQGEWQALGLTGDER